MTGRLADLFRFAWGLLYWNTRKSWFRLRGGRVPCQVLSDSGRAFETGCEACLHWSRPAKFKRVCPLLVETADGLRCSVDTANVRPFWGRALLVFGGSFAALYLGGVLVIFAFLRTVGYPISVVHLAWPGSWHRVGQVRGWFFLERSSRAFAAGRPAEGMLYLNNAYEFDPSNYTVGFNFAQKLQLGHSGRADAVYRRLMQEHPAQRGITAQAWFRSMLARGDFLGVEGIARLQLTEDPTHASVWMRALIFATRELGSINTLQELLASPLPSLQPWRQVLEAELLLRQGRTAQARAMLNTTWNDQPPYSRFYQIRELIRIGESFTAIDLTGKYQSDVDDTARATLLLEAYTTMQAHQSLQRLVDSLLGPPLNLPTIRLLAAYLIRHPNPELLDKFFAKFTQEKIPFGDDSLETYLTLYCTAGADGDWTKLHAVAGKIRRTDGGTSLTLGLVESFFRGQTTHTRIAGLLPALPMPLEVHYALLERYPGPKIVPKEKSR